MNDTLTIGAAVKGLMSLAAGFPAQSATIQIEGAALRFTIDGTDPVAGTTGLIAVVGQTLILQTRDEINKFRGIRETGADTILQIAFEERPKHATNFTNTRA